MNRFTNLLYCGLILLPEKKHLCNLFFQHSQNKKMANHNINIETPKCMDIFKMYSIIRAFVTGGQRGHVPPPL